MDITRFLPFVAVGMAFCLLTGCGGASEMKAGGPPAMPTELLGTWEVSEWLCDTGSGPFNFQRNIGWQFQFKSDGHVNVTDHNGEVTVWAATVSLDEIGFQIEIVAQPDFDEDGMPDFTLRRFCLCKVSSENGEMKLAYGSVSVEADLIEGNVTAKSGRPTRFEADAVSSLLTLHPKQGT